jgi:hypothetical protein
MSVKACTCCLGWRVSCLTLEDFAQDGLLVHPDGVLQEGYPVDQFGADKMSGVGPSLRPSHY